MPLTGTELFRKIIHDLRQEHRKQAFTKDGPPRIVRRQFEDASPEYVAKLGFPDKETMLRVWDDMVAEAMGKVQRELF